jgi:hypothetical protein
LLLPSIASKICDAQASSPSKCENSTVLDAYGPEVAAQAKAFFARIEKAIKNDDRWEFASLIHYPLRVYSPTGDQKINTAAGLMGSYSKVITFAAKQEVLAQSPDCLFANGQGIMVGNGVIWFAQQDDTQMKIIAVNIPHSKRRS